MKHRCFIFLSLATLGIVDSSSSFASSDTGKLPSDVLLFSAVAVSKGDIKKVSEAGSGYYGTLEIGRSNVWRDYIYAGLQSGVMQTANRRGRHMVSTMPVTFMLGYDLQLHGAMSLIFRPYLGQGVDFHLDVEGPPSRLPDRRSASAVGLRLMQPFIKKNIRATLDVRYHVQHGGSLTARTNLGLGMTYLF